MTTRLLLTLILFVVTRFVAKSDLTPFFCDLAGGPAGPRPPTHAFHRRQETSAPSARDPNLMVTASSSPNNFPRPPVTPLRPVHTPKAYP